LGITRENDQDHQRLSNDLSFGVAVEPDSYGQQIRDYQTALPPESEESFHATRREEVEWGEGNAVISHRSYRVDGFYTVLLSSSIESETDLEDLREALFKPHFTPYLGRKSCPPGVPFIPEIIDVAHPLDAVVEYWETRPVLIHNRESEVPNEFDFYWEESLPDHDSFQFENRRSRQRRDEPVSRDRWIFDQRGEVKVRVRRP
jgi:CRISPR system Cascade subunit CasD